MSETEIYNRLNELSSYFSFGRVLQYSVNNHIIA